MHYDASPPANITIYAPQQTAQTTFQVAWSASDPASGVVSYTVEYSGVGDADWQSWLPDTTLSSATFSAPETETDYVFRVTAYDGAGNSGSAQKTTHVGLVRVYMPAILGQWPSWYQYDPYEPNDSLDNAYGPLVSGRVYKAYIWNEDDQDDYYGFSPTSGTNVQVTMTNIPDGTDYDLYVYGFDGQYHLVAFSNQTGNVSETVTFAPVPGRQYYVRIYAYVGYSNQQAYQLSVTYQ
jgi:hypothetical protein